MAELWCVFQNYPKEYIFIGRVFQISYLDTGHTEGQEFEIHIQNHASGNAEMVTNSESEVCGSSGPTLNSNLKSMLFAFGN